MLSLSMERLESWGIENSFSLEKVTFTFASSLLCKFCERIRRHDDVNESAKWIKRWNYHPKDFGSNLKFSRVHFFQIFRIFNKRSPSSVFISLQISNFQIEKRWISQEFFQICGKIEGDRLLVARKGKSDFMMIEKGFR